MRDSLASRPQFSSVEAAAAEDDALRLVAEFQPDVIVVDIATRQSLDVVRAIRRADTRSRIIGFGVAEIEGEILACAEAGLAGYVPGDASLDDVVERIEGIMRGELLVTPRIAAAMFRRLESGAPAERYEGIGSILTSREREVLRLIDGGLSNKEIAADLNIEVSTVKNHVHNLFEKLHVKSRMQAAAHLGSHMTVRQRVLGLAGRPDID
jgi:DNA-binding NarL/FixJ family response regulator